MNQLDDYKQVTAADKTTKGTVTTYECDVYVEDTLLLQSRKEGKNTKTKIRDTPAVLHPLQISDLLGKRVNSLNSTLYQPPKKIRTTRKPIPKLKTIQAEVNIFDFTTTQKSTNTLDLTKKEQEESKILRKYLLKEREKGERSCYIRRNKLVINGNEFTIDELLKSEENKFLLKPSSTPSTQRVQSKNHEQHSQLQSYQTI
ncbi:hypothetical protein JTB14_011078 [Gonioctena quinquepunctata]|nr:hypothetical protein JTB14_011078 [Gonioctena quinquepunctata]